MGIGIMGIVMIMVMGIVMGMGMGDRNKCRYRISCNIGLVYLLSHIRHPLYPKHIPKVVVLLLLI